MHPASLSLPVMHDRLCEETNFSSQRAFLRSNIQSSNCQQHGIGQVITNGELAAEVAFILITSSIETPSRSAYLEGSLRVGDGDASPSRPRIDCYPELVVSKRRLGFEASSSGQVHVRQVI